MTATARCTLLVALSVLGCDASGGEPPRLTLEALCANMETYEGQEIWLDAELDATSFTLWESSVAGCFPEWPCCNTAYYAFVLECNEGVDVVIGPEGYVPGRGDALLCPGRAPGVIPAECPVDCATPSVLAIRSLRGRLGAVRTFAGPRHDASLGPFRELTVSMTTSAPIPDAGPLPASGG
jgi:hypothetical protein